MSIPAAGDGGPTDLDEEAGWETLELVIRLARAGQPYKHLLPDLKGYAARHPSIRAMIDSIVKNNL